jgi:V8-like Glu-specific endopeptidase
MRNLLLLLLSIQTSFAAVTQVYGVDDREDIHKINNPLIQKLALSTAAMFESGSVTKKGDDYTIHDKSLQAVESMCYGERFNYQPATAKCSGFLIAPNLLMTAGHCLIAGMVSPRPTHRRPYRDPMDLDFDFDLDDILNPTPAPAPVTRNNDPPEDSQKYMDIVSKKACKSRKWVFDYNYLDGNPTSVSENSYYTCKKVHFVRYAEKLTEDFAIIELDRKVVHVDGTDRKPLTLNLGNGFKPEQEVFMIGHPAGLPSKLTDNARVIKRENEHQLKVVIDSFGGNSGSAIFDQQTKQVIGILIRGHNDYYSVDTHETDRFGMKKQCKKVYVCEEENATRCNGENVFDLSSLPKYVKEFLEKE